MPPKTAPPKKAKPKNVALVWVIREETKHAETAIQKRFGPFMEKH